MRTTLTLDPDVARGIKARMAGKRASLKQTVNEALRAGLAHLGRERAARFSVEPHSCQFRPGIDLDKLNRLVDELDVERARQGLSR